MKTFQRRLGWGDKRMPIQQPPPSAVLTYRIARFWPEKRAIQQARFASYLRTYHHQDHVRRYESSPKSGRFPEITATLSVTRTDKPTLQTPAEYLQAKRRESVQLESKRSHRAERQNGQLSQMNNNPGYGRKRIKSSRLRTRSQRTEARYRNHS